MKMGMMNILVAPSALPDIFLSKPLQSISTSPSACH